jgi:hypothetical protein
MDDSEITPRSDSPQESLEVAPEIPSAQGVEPPASMIPRLPAAEVERLISEVPSHIAERKRSFRRNLYWLLSLALAAFIVTTWILVRVDSPFGIFVSGPQEIVQAQLRALDRGELRPAYDLFSARYRAQVSVNAWHQLCIAHSEMFHASVVSAETPEPNGPAVTMEIHLRGSDDEVYRARFTLVRTGGRWWIDDVHWARRVAERGVSRT